ncbi:hypothetical protein R9C00_19860 [Flammeovirgaceae bacterium SG7u.111]|nr:hypothetical protein [Flammeovirgaceae bacterium SG7u.132]WPO33956.1 hypothetical protein R9C00_19860 [Flammeovirgaceae bacterium SG7u.111]
MSVKKLITTIFLVVVWAHYLFAQCNTVSFSKSGTTLTTTYTVNNVNPIVFDELKFDWYTNAGMTVLAKSVTTHPSINNGFPYTTNGVSITWTNNNRSYTCKCTFTASSGTTYYAKVTSTRGTNDCSATAGPVSFDPAPSTPNITDADGYYCQACLTDDDKAYVTLKGGNSAYNDIYKIYKRGNSTAVVSVASSGASNKIAIPGYCTTAKYYATIQRGNMASGQTADFSLTNKKPAKPTVQDEARCGAGDVVFTVSGTVAGLEYHWYNAQGDEIGTPGTSITVKNLAVSSSPYLFTVKAKNTAYGCWSDVKTVKATVDEIPGLPTVSDKSICGSGSTTLTANLEGASSYRWYDAATGGKLKKSGPDPFDTPYLSANTNYWVSAVSAAGCEGPRQKVTVFTDSPNTVTFSKSAMTLSTEYTITSITNYTIFNSFNLQLDWYTNEGMTVLAKSVTTHPSINNGFPYTTNGVSITWTNQGGYSYKCTCTFTASSGITYYVKVTEIKDIGNCSATAGPVSFDPAPSTPDITSAYYCSTCSPIDSDDLAYVTLSGANSAYGDTYMVYRQTTTGANW